MTPICDNRATTCEETVDNLKRDVLVATITALTTLAGSFFIMQGDVRKADADVVQTLYNQVNSLQKQVFSQQAEIMSLRIELARKYESSVIIKQYLDAMPHPAWVKTVDLLHPDNPLTMWHINDEYSRLFGITQARYAASTDYDVWPTETADQFFENDQYVLRVRGNLCTKETFPAKVSDVVSTTSPPMDAFVCKWYTEVAGKPAVAGQILLESIFE